MARIVAQHEPKMVVIAGRNQGPLDETRKAILSESPKANIRTLIIDLANFESVKKAAEEVNAYGEREKIDILVANAGLMASPLAYLPAPNSHIEAQFGVNHLGHFLFTNLILRAQSSSQHTEKQVRVVTLSSVGHTFQPADRKGINWEKPGMLKGRNGEGYDKWDAYAQAKTATVLYAGALRRRGWEAVSVHPGGVDTALGRHLTMEENVAAGFIDETGAKRHDKYFWKTLSQGVSTHLLGAFAPWSALCAPDQKDAIYLVDTQVSSQEDHAKGEEDEERLWALSEQMVGHKFDL